MKKRDPRREARKRRERERAQAKTEDELRRRVIPDVRDMINSDDDDEGDDE